MIQGDFYDGTSSRRHRGYLRVEDGVLRIEDEQGNALVECQWQLTQVSSRLGNTPRYLDLPLGQRFETNDNDSIDRLQRLAGRDRGLALIHRLESHWRLALASLLVVVLASWWFFAAGIPMLAKGAAAALPPSVLDQTADLTLRALETGVLEPSTLPAERQQQLQALFRPYLPVGQGITYQVRFYAGGAMKANAFALPNGTLVFTDELVALSDDDRELLAVLAHEIGHVEARHGLRQTLQGSSVALITAVVVGDATAFGSLLAGLPTVLLDAHYSRDFEREADHYALDLLAQHQLGGDFFAAMLERLAASHGESEESVGRYLSSHPPSAERIAAAKAYQPDQ